MPDFAHKLVRFTGALRDAGLSVSIEQTQTFARALELVDALSRTQFYYAARATLVTRREHYAAFDEVFERIWGSHVAGPQKAPQAPRHDPRAFHRTVLTSFLSEKARAGDREITLGDRRETASPSELLQRRDFAHVSDREREALRRAMRTIEWRVTARRTRRRIRAARGAELDMRRIVQRRAACAGCLFELPRRARKVKPRPLVLLADISGSMELYARIVLQFFHGLSQAQPHAETFVFGTRLTRITRELKQRDVDQALDRVAHQVDDYAGGTRIGACFAQFNRVWSRHVLRRGAVLIVVSDGCDVGDSAQLAREMRWLRDRSHRVIWLNPRLGGRDYRPLARGMAAALDYVDDFLPIHNLQALAQLAELLSKLPAQRSERGR
jgi:uncharacterized protein